MGSTATMTRFAEVYNDIVKYPTLADVARELGMAYQTVKNTAVILRRRAETDESVPKIIMRAGKSAVPKSNTARREIQTEVPDFEEPVDELLRRACEYNERFERHVDAKSVIDIAIKVPGPFGVVGLPDPHLNNPGTQLRKALDDAYLIESRPELFAVAIGDWIDNFIIGRLERERRKDIMSHSDSWRLLEHYFQTLASSMVIGIGGNHMEWSTSLGGVDYLKKLFEAEGLGPIYDPDEVRVRLNTPSGRSFIHHARHRYPGHSKYNSVHGVLVWMLERWQGEDVFWGGDIHTSGYTSIEKLWLGQRRDIHGIQLATYKKIDGYQKTCGFRQNQPFLTPMVIHDPATGDTHFFKDIAFGVKVLDKMRRDAGF